LDTAVAASPTAFPIRGVGQSGAEPRSRAAAEPEAPERPIVLIFCDKNSLPER